MANQFCLYQNKNTKSTTFGKYYARPIHDNKFLEVKELAEFIQTQASVKRSDVKAVIDEMGYAIMHFLGQGRKVKIEGLGIFKPTVTSKPLENLADWDQAKYLKPTHLLFTPETEAVGGTRKRSVVAVKEVSWEMAEVAVDGNGDPLVGRVQIRAAKEAAGGNGE